MQVDSTQTSNLEVIVDMRNETLRLHTERSQQQATISLLHAPKTCSMRALTTRAIEERHGRRRSGICGNELYPIAVNVLPKTQASFPFALMLIWNMAGGTLL